MSNVKKDETHHIARIDIYPSDEHPNRSSTHGWLVRVRRQGERVGKFFSDKKYGGKDKALYDHAIPYRDKLLEEMPPPDDPVRRSAEARSRSGVIGLHLSSKDIGNGTRKPYIQLSWTSKDGRRRSTSFSVEKWGLRRAIWNGCKRLHQERKKFNELNRESDPEKMYRTAYPNIRERYIEDYEQDPPEMDPDRAEVLGLDDSDIPQVTL